MDLSEALLAAIAESKSNLTAARVFTVLGPNGAGKTRLLRALAGALGDAEHKLFVPARRTPSLGSMAVGANFASRSLDGVLREIIDNLTSGNDQPIDYSLTSALAAVLEAARKVAADARRKHGEDLLQWSEGGKSGPAPERDPSPVDEILTALSDVTGYTALLQKPNPYNPDELQISFRKGATEFAWGALSDGEQQVLALFVLLSAASEDRFIFLVDEPEIHLNEARAIELWSTIETRFPRAIFIYATHNLSFASRQTDGRLFFLASDGSGSELDTTSPLPTELSRTIAGARVQILITEAPPVFCEDELHQLFLKDVLLNCNAFPLAVGGHDNVRSAVSGEMNWSLLRTASKQFCGVVDRDSHSDAEVSAAEARNSRIIHLQVFEVESVILEPAMMRLVFQGYDNSDLERRYTDILCDAAFDALHASLTSLKSHLEYHLRPQISFNVGADPLSVDVTTPAADAADLMRSRHLDINSAIGDKDIPRILKLVDGKRLFSNVQRRLRTLCPLHDPTPQYRLLSHQKGFATALREIEWVPGIRERILNALEL